ncbi:MFS transporter [Cupriavidus plantarum]|uniref:Putative MFS family arabinose efflux permease n=1 Tax=Cupriavidus plantarum TaxID=942865 RepID=A0A316ELD3_9BURK|nr:MFS transporter [Cupriavidus plantarum]NYI02401.1 MFS family permease [Cupriavidus plantarum]PWK31606.1 putative MFS family arabinose efflux permease [Cupriavidus plantarum]REE85453.1 putative MFS family arabinose efflux permease [Cupriavidus plantarum]RLK28745.1 putative MFS family arabinose efflux permease [Cupriavidus plantarum]CAG2145785.1 L-lactate transporter [Cupriavidus plantarum]
MTNSSQRWWQTTWGLVLAGGLIMGIALGVRHVQGMFLLPIIMDRGWTRESFGLAMAVQNLTWGLAQPVTGMLADRFGSWKVMVGGLLLYGIGLIAMTHATTVQMFIWTGGICIGIAQSGTTFGVVYGALSRMVPPARRSWALGVAGAIGGIGQFLLVPTAQAMLSGMGWRSALLWFGIVALVLLPMGLPFQDRKPVMAEEDAAQPRLLPALREAFAHRGFWLLNLGFLACGFQLAFIASHLPAYLIDKGLQPRDGMAALAIIALSNVAGIYVFGLLGARYTRKYLLAMIYLLRTATMALFVLLPLTSPGLYLFAAAMGFMWLGTVPLTNGIVSQIFGVRYLATLFGFVFFGHQLGSFLGVWLGGAVFEATHSYDLVWLCAMALGVVAAALHWPIDDRELVRAAPGLAMR